MANRGGRTLYIQRSKFWDYSSSSSGAAALLCAGRSSEFLHNRLLQERSKTLVFGGCFSICKAFAAARLWAIGRYFCSSSVHQTSAAAAVVVRVQRLPTPPPTIYHSPPVSLSSPWLAIRPRVGIAEEEEQEEADPDYYKFWSIADAKEYMVKKQVRAGWQRELLTPDNAICVGSSHGWLAFVHPGTYHHYLFNPFIACPEQAYIPLPSLETIGFIDAVRAVKPRNLFPSSGLLVKDFIKDGDDHFSPSQVSEQYPIEKVAMSSNPSNGNGNGNCIVMIIYHLCLFFCLPGGEGECWTRCHAEGLGYIEITYFSKDRRFYAIDHFGELSAFDLNDPSCPKTQVISYGSSLPHPHLACPHGLYLVECSGDLLLVLVATKYGDGCDQFYVYRLDFDKHEWEPVNCLGQNALFVGYSNSFSLSTRDHPEFKPNSVYFTDNFFTIFHFTDYGFTTYGQAGEHQTPGLDNGVFNLEDRSTELYYSALKRSLGVFPNTLWVAPNTP